MSNNCHSCPCDKNPCDPSGAAARLKCSTYARITRRVRMPMSLFLSKRSAFSISQRKMLLSGSTGVPKDSFSGPSDRSIPSVNPITGKVGVDKKHNSLCPLSWALEGSYI